MCVIGVWDVCAWCARDGRYVVCSGGVCQLCSVGNGEGACVVSECVYVLVGSDRGCDVAYGGMIGLY